MSEQLSEFNKIAKTSFVSRWIPLSLVLLISILIGLSLVFDWKVAVILVTAMIAFAKFLSVTGKIIDRLRESRYRQSLSSIDRTLNELEIAKDGKIYRGEDAQIVYQTCSDYFAGIFEIDSLCKTVNGNWFRFICRTDRGVVETYDLQPLQHNAAADWLLKVDKELYIKHFGEPEIA